MFRFAAPLAFLLLLPWLLAAWRIYRPARRTGLLFSAAARVPARATWRVAAARFLPALFLAGLLLIIVALARPQTVLSRVRDTSNVIAIQMTVDLSGSMAALDMSDIAGNRIVRPRTRLDVVKETFAAFIARRPDDLIGFVTFGGYAFTRAPLTADHEALLHILNALELPRPLAAGGTVTDQEELMTAIGDGLATAIARIEPARVKSRTIVLLSDGESNTGIVEPVAAAEAAKKLGVRVYTIGIGTTGRAPVAGKDLFGRDIVDWMDVRLDEDLLRGIAETTGGTYYNARDPEGLTRALAEIDRLEKTEVERSVYEQFTEWFPRLLWPGIGLVVLAGSLNLVIARRLA